MSREGGGGLGVADFDPILSLEIVFTPGEEEDLLVSAVGGEREVVSGKCDIKQRWRDRSLRIRVETPPVNKSGESPEVGHCEGQNNESGVVASPTAALSANRGPSFIILISDHFEIHLINRLLLYPMAQHPFIFGIPFQYAKRSRKSNNGLFFLINSPRDLLPVRGSSLRVDIFFPPLLTTRFIRVLPSCPRTSLISRGLTPGPDARRSGSPPFVIPPPHSGALHLLEKPEAENGNK